MISFHQIVIFVLSVFFSWIVVYHSFCLWNMWNRKESFVYISPYDENAKGDAEDDEDDPFFKKMNAEFTPVGVTDVDNMVYEMDKEVELSPEEIDYPDDEIPQKKQSSKSTEPQPNNVVEDEEIE